MEQLSIYWHPNCTTCKNAVKYLKKKNASFELLDLRETSPSKKAIQAMMKNYPDPKKLFNTSGQAYRNQGLKDKISDMSPIEMAEALSADGLLVKRPFVLLKNGKGVVGFKEPEWKQLGL